MKVRKQLSEAHFDKGLMKLQVRGPQLNEKQTSRNFKFLEYHLHNSTKCFLPKVKVGVLKIFLETSLVEAYFINTSVVKNIRNISNLEIFPKGRFGVLLLVRMFSGEKSNCGNSKINLVNQCFFYRLFSCGLLFTRICNYWNPQHFFFHFVRIALITFKGQHVSIGHCF